jgi:hypothetical protein
MERMVTIGMGNRVQSTGYDTLSQHHRYKVLNTPCQKPELQLLLSSQIQHPDAFPHKKNIIQACPIHSPLPPIMSEHQDDSTTILHIWQQNLNTSLKAQHSLLNGRIAHKCEAQRTWVSNAGGFWCVYVVIMVV